jgi:hypothetical protein
MNASQNNRTSGTAGTRGECEQHRERAADKECSAPVTQARAVREDVTRRGAEGRTDSAREPRRLRFRLFTAAGQLVTTGRRRILLPGPPLAPAPDVTSALDRLAQLPNPG